MKRIFSLSLAVMTTCLMFTGCGAGSSGKKVEAPSSKPISSFDEANNFTMPEDGEEIAVFTIKDYGTIKVKLFPELVPKAVENFKGLINKGYYNGLIYHRVIKDFMIQGGDPTGTGGGGESLWGKKFPCEFSSKLCHFEGAVAYARANGDYNNGSQFYMVTGMGLDESKMKYFADSYGKKYSDKVSKMYAEKGGSPHLDGDYTVFGQIFEGLDVALNISKTPTGTNDKPKTQVVIEKAEIVKYSK